MATFTEVFERKEQKYVLNPRQLLIVEAAVEENMQPGEFGTCEVRSLYFDTPAFDVIERSLDKPVYKEKLRLRTYGKPSPDSEAFVELKKKFKGVVYKRRVRMSLAAAEAYLDGLPYEQAVCSHPLEDADAATEALSPTSLQIASEIDFLRSRHEGLSPSFLVSCQRRAFENREEGGEDDGLRVTIDSRLQSASGVSSIYEVERALPIIDQDLCVLEAKNNGALPFWLVDALGEAKAYPRSFSKCGIAYMNTKGCGGAPALLEVADCSKEKVSLRA